MKLFRRVIAVVCMLTLCAACVVQVSAASKESNTADYSTAYGTFHGNLYTNRGTTSAATRAQTTCYSTSGNTPYAPKLYALAEMMSWSTGATLNSGDKWGYNTTESTTNTISAATTNYVTVYGYHGVYNADGSTVKTAGTQTIKG